MFNTTLKSTTAKAVVASRTLRKKEKAHLRTARRKEERQSSSYATRALHSITHHERTVTMRKELRAMHLASAFIKGTPYGRVEDSSCRKPVDIKAVSRYVSYNDQVTPWVKAWIEGS